MITHYISRMAYQLQKNVQEDVNDSYQTNYGVDFSKKFLNVAHSYRLSPLVPSKFYTHELKTLKDYLVPWLLDYQEKHQCFKLHITLFCEFLKRNTNEKKSFHLDTRSRTVLEGDEIENTLSDILDELLYRIETKLDLGSDYVYQSLLHVDVLFLEYR